MKRVFLSFFAVFAALILLASCSGGANITALALDTSEANLVYGLGEEVNVEDIVATLTYDNGKSQVISIYNCKIDLGEVNKNKEGTYPVKVSYTLNKVTVEASFNVIYEVQMDGLALGLDDVPTEFLIGSEFSASGLQVNIHYSDGEMVEYTGTDYVVDSSNVNMEEEGTYEVVVSLVVDGKTLTGKYEISVIGMHAYISSVEDFLAMREFADENGINERSYTLTCDIDLAGIELTPTKTTFKGVLDGAGYTIKNAKFTTDSSKQGMLFFLIEGATVKNLKFFACTIVGGASEATALIAGECNAVGATFKNIEFSCCTVNNGAQNYAALLIGRNEKEPVVLNFEGITVKNMTSITSSKYGGVLIGDSYNGTMINAKDCDLDFTASCSSEFSVFGGRLRGEYIEKDGETIVKQMYNRINVENVIIRGKFASLGNKIGVFSMSMAKVEINAKNVLILEWGQTKESDMLYGNTKTAPSSQTYENVYYVSEDCQTTTSVSAGVSAVSKADVNSTYILTTVLKDSTSWEADANKVVKLVASSANTPSEGATVKELKLITDAVDVQYFVGEALSTEGLLVTAIYTDGCVIALDEYAVSVKDASGNPVADFQQAAIGQYKVVVTSGSASAEYVVNVVKETGVTVNHEWVKKVYTVGQKLDLADIAVFAEISDGTHTLLTASGYTAAVYSGATAIDDLSKAAAGTYTVVISRGDFKASFEIDVVNAVDAEELVVKVYVDASVENGSLNDDGHLQFNTISQANDYLESLGLDELTKKEIYLAKGTYTEKITFVLTNITLYGATSKYEDTVIAYDSYADMLKPDETASYGTDGSAAITIKSSAAGFSAQNIYFKNTFDYNGSTAANKQALAVLCQADKALFVNCGFSGNQDTLEAKEGRQYYLNCYIEGNVDFIFGNNASVVFEGCQINAVTRYKNGEPENNNGYVCATKGYSSSSGVDTVTYNYVFLNCQFTADEDVLPGSMSIARPWGTDSSVVTIGCHFSNAYSVLGYDGSAKSRYFDMSGVKPEVARFYEYNNTGSVPAEEVAGMKFLTAEEAAEYSLANIFAQVNGQKDYGTAWDVQANPADSEFVSYIVKYESEKTTYSVGDILVPTVKEVTSITGNPFVGWTVVKETVVEKFYDAEGNEVENITAKAGEYIAKLFVGETVFADMAFEVIATDAPEIIVVSTTLDASELPSTVDQNTAYKDIFTVIPKVGSTVTVSNAPATAVDAEGNAYTKMAKISGGKTTVSSEKIENCLQVIVEKAGKIIAVVSQKNAAASFNDGVKLALYASDGTILSQTEIAIAAADGVLDTITFEVSEAGTYYIGSISNGFYLYSVTYSYEKEAPKPVIETIATTLDASELPSTVDQNTAYKDIFTVIPKVGSTVTVSNAPATAVDAEGNAYTKMAKISGGKTTVSSDKIENCLQVVVVKAGKIIAVVSQKNAAASFNDGVKLALYASDGTILSQTEIAIAAADGVLDTITFEVSEAGTYYIGSISNGFYLYSVTYSYEEVVTPEVPLPDVPVVKNLVPTHTITAEELATSLDSGKWGDYITLLTTDSSKQWTVDSNTKKMIDVNGSEISVPNRLKSGGKNPYLSFDFTGYDGQVKLQIFAMTSSSNDLTRTMTLSSTSSTLDSFTLSENAVMCFEIIVDAGQVYTLNVSGGVNFYGINFIAIE